MVLNTLLHLVIILGLTWAFCYGTGSYTLRRATDALMGFSFIYLLLGITIWVGRAARFYTQTDHFKGLYQATSLDRGDLPLARRRWLLWIYENHPLIAWVVAGLILITLAIVVGSMMTDQFPPNTVLNFLVKKNLPPELQPGGYYNP